MKTVRIDEKIVGAFRGLDPFETLDRLPVKGSFVLGSVAEEDEFDEPVGLLVGTIENDRLVLHWLFVDPDYRDEGLGSYLLMLAFEEADRRGLSQVVARISDEYDMDDPGWDSWGFFVNDVFKEAEEDEFVLRTSMKEMTKLLDKESKRNESLAKAPGILPIKSLSQKERIEAVKNINRHFAINMDVPVESLLSAADPGMSFVKNSNGDYVGMIVMRRGEQTWYMDALYSIDDVDEEMLFRAVLHYCEDFVKITDSIEIAIKKKSIESLLEEINMPGKKYAVSYLTASVSDYRQMKARNQAV